MKIENYPIDYRCEECGSADVVWDAWCAWDPVKQEYYMSSGPMQQAYCNVCEGETTLSIVVIMPLEDVTELREAAKQQPSNQVT